MRSPESHLKEIEKLRAEHTANTKRETSTTLVALSAIVSGFRKGILNGRSDEGMCYVVCLPLQSFLKEIGIETKLIEGEVSKVGHFWLELPDGRIIDPTANQFDTPMPAIYIGPLPPTYKLL